MLITLGLLCHVSGVSNLHTFILYFNSSTHVQVLDLLDAMGMKQYQDKFKQEQVNGEILSECDEELLSSDLGVTSKLHRMRLMKIITG